MDESGSASNRRSYQYFTMAGHGEYLPLTAFLQSLDNDVAPGTRGQFLAALGRKLVLAHGRSPHYTNVY
eukprot:COSAG02_NODE_424_length_22575_cov_79.088361_9_plen_69_part_00